MGRFILSAIAGGLVTATALSSHGLLVALVAAPFGGSAAALVAGLSIAHSRSRRNRVEVGDTLLPTPPPEAKGRIALT
jgi:hypothetical protein